MTKSLTTKLATIAAVSAVSLSLVSPVLAVDKDGFKDARQEIKDMREEAKEKLATRPGLFKKFFERAAIGTGQITAINGTTFTVSKDGKSYTVNTDSKTQFRRRFWGKASLSEFAVGNMVNVIGTWADDAHTTIQATLVRDLSLQKRFAVFVGTVQSLTANGFVLQTFGRGTQTVTVDTNTKFVNRKEETIQKSDVLVGHRIRVKGMWDRSNNTVTEVSQVKDYTLPLQPKTSVTPTPSTPATSSATQNQ